MSPFRVSRNRCESSGCMAANVGGAQEGAWPAKKGGSTRDLLEVKARSHKAMSVLIDSVQVRLLCCMGRCGYLMGWECKRCPEMCPAR